MKKRILSIILAICMVSALVPVMPITASAEGTCNCPAKCTDSYKDADCPVCKVGGTCESRRKRRIYDDGTGITTQFHLQAALDWKDAAHYLYYFPLDADITVSSNITVPGNADFVLDLNGHTLSGDHVRSIFVVYGKLTIIDTKGTGKLIDSKGALDINGGYVLMKGGTIENCTVYGGVLVRNGGTFKMTGGTLKNNECYDGLMFEGKYYPGSIYCTGGRIVIIDGSAQVLCCDQDKCDICSATLSEHTGGTATCTEKAVCEYCHKEYGEPKGHSYKETIVQPTEFTLGGTQHICDNCGDQYWDNFTKEDTSYKLVIPGGITLYDYFTISEEPEIAVKVEFDNPVVSVFLQDPLGTLKRMEDDGIKIYKITEGAEQVVVRSDKKIVFRSDAPFDEFDQVMINGLVLDKKYYSVKKGSTIVTLNEDFAKQIPTGMHLFGIISKDGVAITTFTVDDKATADNDTKSPQTGDNNHIALWIALFFVSGGVIGTTIVKKEKAQ